jgi:hypothetical protein
MCTSPQTCGGAGTANVCGCTPESDTAFCARLSKNCGQVVNTDNCSQPRMVASCGTCTGSQTCGGGGTANVCGCTPTTCALQGKNCGSIPDGCGNMLNCGSCSSGTCGGGGSANVCGTACYSAYNRASCQTYTTGTKVSVGGHNYTCANGTCANCYYQDPGSGKYTCDPGYSGSPPCPWGNNWTDNGACQ